MPEVRQFKKGSILYFDGEVKTSYAYLLKKGVLSRTKLSVETGKPERSRLQIGEFFGIKASLGVARRDETITVHDDAVVLQFSPQEFYAVMQRNVNIMFKTLRAFSNELRNIHHSIEKSLYNAENDSFGSTADGLFSVGDYYFNKRDYQQSRYAFDKFIDHHPQHKKVAKAQENIKFINDVLKTSEENSGSAGASSSSGSEAKDYSFELGESREFLKEMSGDSELYTHFNYFIEGYSKGDFKYAAQALKKASEMAQGDDVEELVKEKIHIGKIRVLYYLGKYENAIKAGKVYLKEMPESRYTQDALLVLALSYKKLDKDDMKTTILKKVIASKKSRQDLIKLAKENL